MSFFDLSAFFNRISQQVNGGVSRAGTWTRTKVLNLRRQRRKSTTATTANTQKPTNGETSKRESKHKRTNLCFSAFFFVLFCFDLTSAFSQPIKLNNNFNSIFFQFNYNFMNCLSIKFNR